MAENTNASGLTWPCEAAWCRENDLIDSTCTLGRFGSFSDLFQIFGLDVFGGPDV